MFFAGMRLLRLAHSILDHPVGVVLVGPVSPGSWPGGAWVPWRALPWSCCVLVLLSDPGSQLIALSHCFTCKTGFAQIHEDG